MTAQAEQAGERLELVDALRGYALFGLLMVHMVELFELYWLDPRPDPWFDGVFAIFAGKSFAIFALLFGFSFATIMANNRALGVDFTGRFAWRLALLAAIGTLHGLLYRGDILQVLAVMGLLLIPLSRVSSTRALMVIAGLFFLQIPLLLQSFLAGEGMAIAQRQPIFFGDTGLARIADADFATLVTVNLGPGLAGKWSFYLSTGRVSQIAALFVVGMLLHRSGAFAQIEARRKAWLAVLGASAIGWAFLASYGSLLVAAWPEQGGAPMQAQTVQWALESWRASLLTAFQIAVFVLLWQWGARGMLRWFALPGRMTLTLYVLQSCVAVPLLYGFGLGLWHEVTLAQMVWAGLAFFALQIAFAAWWYRRYRYGPLEWLWRAATLTTSNVPMRRSGR